MYKKKLRNIAIGLLILGCSTEQEKNMNKANCRSYERNDKKILLLSNNNYDQKNLFVKFIYNPTKVIGLNAIDNKQKYFNSYGIIEMANNHYIESVIINCINLKSKNMYLNHRINLDFSTKSRFNADIKQPTLIIDNSSLKKRITSKSIFISVLAGLFLIGLFNKKDYVINIETLIYHSLLEDIQNIKRLTFYRKNIKTGKKERVPLNEQMGLSEVTKKRLEQNIRYKMYIDFVKRKKKKISSIC